VPNNRIGSNDDFRLDARPGLKPAQRQVGPASPPSKKKSNRAFWGLMTPAMVVLLLMTLAPAIFLFQKSLTNASLLQDSSKFVGLENYKNILTDPAQIHAGYLTIFFIVLVVSSEMILGMFFAQFLYQKTRSNNIAGALLIIPFAVAPAVSAMVFRELLNPNYGWIDYFMGLVGLPSHVDWLSNSVTAWVSIVGLDIWQWTPFVTLILAAGLSAVSGEILEAASVDGASGWQTFRHITFPLLAPFIGIALVLRTVQAFKTFDSFLILTGGGPGDSTSTINLAIYRVALQSFRIGYASAMAILLLIVISTLTPLLLRILSRVTRTEVRV
jgi:multiple sugar transport system permease protein